MKSSSEIQIQQLNDIFRLIPLFETPQMDIKSRNIKRVNFLLIQKELELVSQYFEKDENPPEYEIEELSERTLMWINSLYEILFRWFRWTIDIESHKRNIDKSHGDESKIAKVVQQLERKISLNQLQGRIDNASYTYSFYRVREEIDFFEKIKRAKLSINPVITDLQDFEMTLIKDQKRKSTMPEEQLVSIREISPIDGSIQWKLYQGDLSRKISRSILTTKLYQNITTSTE